MRNFVKKHKILISGIPILTGIITAVLILLSHDKEVKFRTYDAEGNEIEITEEQHRNRIKKQKSSEVKGKMVHLAPGYEEFMKSYTQEKMIQKMNEHLNMPSENDLGDMPVNNWIFKGPYSADSRIWSGMKICGRIRDLEIEGVPSLRAAGATGGVFGSVLIFPYPLNDNITTLSIGSFATNPTDSAKILIGTGEPEHYPGNGMWRTTNGGQTWNQIPSNYIPQSGQIREIRFQPGSGTTVHAATSNGYYKSVDGGITWVQRLTGNIESLDVAPLAPNIIWITKRNDGVYKSTNWGDNFIRQNNYPLTGSNFKTASISIAYSSITTVYVSASGDDGMTKGQHRSTDGGTTWQDITWRVSGNIVQIHGANGQGSRNNCIGVSPTNPNLVIVGGVDGIRSTNGGTSWAYIPLNIGTVHDDFCVIKWHSNGSSVYIGTDGGISHSVNGGATFSTVTSIFPAMQFWGIDAAANSSGFVITGGTQDNSIVNTSNNGTTWFTYSIADASHTTIDKNNPAVQMSTLFFGSVHSVWRTTNYGGNWTDVTVPYSASEGGMIRNDMLSPVWYYVNRGNRVYVSTNVGASWSQVGTSFPDAYVANISVGRYSAPYAPLYAVLPNTTTRVMLFDGSNWVQRNTGLPTANMSVMGQHPTNNNIALISTAYESYPGQKIYKTTNKGVSWTNISGNFPNFSITSLILHPTLNNVMFASTTWWGVYKTTDGGANWFRWMNGMPQSQWVEALAYVDSSSINGRFYVVAGTHGRGAYVRDASGDDPLTGTNNNNTNIPREYSLRQNYPNPFNPATTIKFDLPVSDLVSIQIFDITGKRVKELANNQLFNAGSHEVRFEGSNLSSGAYFYRITTPKYTDVKKMVLVK